MREENKLMEDRQLHSSQKEALEKMLEFSGETNKIAIHEWLSNLVNLFDMIKLKFLETMGKLKESALRWYQENLAKFTGWQEVEHALRERFTERLSDSQLKQEEFKSSQ